MLDVQEVTGSSPVPRTKDPKLRFRVFFFVFCTANIRPRAASPRPYIVEKEYFPTIFIGGHVPTMKIPLEHKIAFELPSGMRT